MGGDPVLFSAAQEQPVEEEEDEEEGEVEDESLVSHYLQVVRPTSSSKLHLPLPAHRISALGTDRPVPRCGARGDYWDEPWVC